RLTRQRRLGLALYEPNLSRGLREKTNDFICRPQQKCCPPTVGDLAGVTCTKTGNYGIARQNLTFSSRRARQEKTDTRPLGSRPAAVDFGGHRRNDGPAQPALEVGPHRLQGFTPGLLFH